MRDTPDVKDIPFSRIPHQSDLYLAYLDLKQEALSFYQRPPTLDALEKAAQELSASVTYPRQEMAAILQRQNTALGADDGTLQKVQELGYPDCVAIVTGQQVGLFTGPLYTIYKTMTALRLAAELRKRRIRAVPVFWMDSEDHDLAEVTKITLRGANDSAAAVDFRELIFDGERPEGQPVGSIQFPEGILRAVKEYASSIPDSDWKAGTQSWLESTYRPGSSFAEAFGGLMTRLFKGTGLVMFDPQDRAAKKLLRPLFQQAVEDSSEIHEALRRRSRDLEAAGFAPQVSMLEGSTVLFFMDGKNRRALTKPDELFALKNTDRLFAKADLAELAGRSPELFSPNVLLRPLTQDYLFPTAAYVAGPAEVAYFAQVEALYRFFGRPMPAIWPRAGFTLLDPEIGSDMEQCGIEFEDCFQGKQYVMEKMVQASKHSKAGPILNALAQDLKRTLEDLRPAMAAVDPSLHQAAETAKRKILHQVEGLRGRIVRLEAGQNQQLLHMTDRLLDSCYPNKNLQERELSVHPFLARYGPSLLDTIYALVKPASFAHHVVRL